MRVRFKNIYFGKDGNRYRPGRWHEVPDSWRDILPRGAEIDDSVPIAVKPVEKKKPALNLAT